MAALTLDLIKTQWTNTSRRHGTPNHHWIQKLNTGLQAAWILCLSTLPPDSRPWFPNEKQNLLLSEKRTLDHWATVQFFFSLAQVRCFWRCFCFRSGLVALFLKMSERGDSWCTDSSFSPLLVKLSQVFESALLDSILKLAVIPVACAHLCTPNSSFQSTLHLICFDTALLEQPYFTCNESIYNLKWVHLILILLEIDLFCNNMFTLSRAIQHIFAEYKNLFI